MKANFVTELETLMTYRIPDETLMTYRNPDETLMTCRNPDETVMTYRNPDETLTTSHNYRKISTNLLSGLTNKWQMNFNVDNCPLMHIRHNNVRGNNNISNQMLLTTDRQRDLGIIITKHL